MKYSLSDDITHVLSEDLPWDLLAGKCIAITGANGMLASFLTETLLHLNDRLSSPMKVVGLVRNINKARARFSACDDNGRLVLREWNVDDVDINVPECNILIHAASIPRPDDRHPVDVIAPNVIGTRNLLEYARCKCSAFDQFIFFSSGAVYGDGFVSEERIGEDRYFPINQLNPVSCYAESKRMGENICVSYMRQFGINVRMLRYFHTYGPGMDLGNDPRSFVDFINRVVKGRDIELMSDGGMKRCFCYVSDATIALFRVLFYGSSGEAYNIANDSGYMSIYELARLIARLGGDRSRVVVNGTMHRDVHEGYAPQGHTARPDLSKMMSLGYVPSVSPEKGFKKVLDSIMRKQ